MPISRYIVVALAKCSSAFKGVTRSLVQLAEAELAVGDEGAHTELFGERECVTVVAVSVLRGIAAGGDLAEEAEGPRLVGA
jgi:hypothetical protein